MAAALRVRPSREPPRVKADPNVLAHQEWIGFVQPAGLVVSATALVRAGAILPRRDTEGQRLLVGCVTDTPAAPGQEPTPALPDFEAFARGVLGWSFSPKGFAGGPAGEIPERAGRAATRARDNARARPGRPRA